ncbi:hypothetical protein H9P43_000621 [Blastocladiella emersonii ATCC 22665]|nr:hypothetical protein H9P43_000621 [Blastocladiella emersonii ATCC 22665]
MPNFLAKHFADTRRRTTPERIERERYLWGTVPFKRWMMLPTGAMIQMTAGSFYAWSVYNGPIVKHFDDTITHEAIAEVFYCAVGFFGIASCLSGPWLERHGPRRMSTIGALLFFVGHLISALGTYLKLLPLMYLGYGLFGGLGIGMTYPIPVAVLQQWYPDYRGFSAGISVGAFGLGSVIASFTQSALLQGLGPTLTFLILGCTYAAIHLTCSWFMRFPPPNYTVPHKGKGLDVHASQPPMAAARTGRAAAAAAEYTPTIQDAEEGHAPAHDDHADDHHHHHVHGSDTRLNAGAAPAGHNAHDALLADPLAHVRGASHVSTGHHAPGAPMDEDEFGRDLKSVDFRYIYALFFLGVIPGLVLVSRVADMVQSAFGQTVATSTWIVGVNGMFNVLGRLVMGLLSDKVARLKLMVTSILASIAAMVAMYISLSNNIFPLFIVSIWVLTGAYGATSSLIPGILADSFGSAHIGALYGTALTGWAAGGVIGGVGFTALINQQKVSGVDPKHVYDVCLYSMIPLAALGIVITVLFMIRRRKVPAVQHDLHRTLSVSSMTGGRYAVAGVLHHTGHP